MINNLGDLIILITIFRFLLNVLHKITNYWDKNTYHLLEKGMLFTLFDWHVKALPSFNFGYSIHLNDDDDIAANQILGIRLLCLIMGETNACVDQITVYILWKEESHTGSQILKIIHVLKSIRGVRQRVNIITLNENHSIIKGCVKAGITVLTAGSPAETKRGDLK